MKALLQIFLTDFHSCSQAQKIKKVESLVDSDSIDVIVSLAELDSEFSAICALPQFNAKWVSSWSTYGAILTKDIKKALYDQPTMHNKFALFLGIYYYHQALETASKFKKDYSASEISSLQKAIKYQSIHACQRYNIYLYSQMDNNKYEYSDELFCKIIRQIKPLLPLYGCYAYIMLAEAYVRYGMFLRHWEHNDKANNSFSSALQACQKAQRDFKPESVSIYNASFGGTLAESNSLRLSEIEEIIVLIHTLKADYVGQDFFDVLHQKSISPTAN